MIDHTPPPAITAQAVNTIHAMSERGFANPRALVVTARTIAVIALAKVDIMDKVCIRRLTNQLIKHAYDVTESQ